MEAIPTTERILIEDVLKHIYHCQQKNRRPTLESIAGVLQVSVNEASLLIAKMTSRNLLKLANSDFLLTPAGENYALQVIRAHRLWERYLADETGFHESEWHERAEREEHLLTPTEIEALAARLGHPTHDPHGDPIPTATGDFVPHGGQSLNALETGQAARIVHLEDEPPVVYAQLVAEGLYPGLEIRIKEKTPERIRFLAGAEECVLAPLLARNVSVIPLADEEITAPVQYQRLSGLPIGQTARVVSISPACRGVERRRFMDLGILPGTVIKAEMVSPSGDPTAYFFRQSLIGLRREQADYIFINRNLEESQ